MAKSPLAESFKSFEDKKPYTFSSEEVEQYNRILERIIKARNQREQPRDEFDGMTYEQAYLANKRASMSYLVPKKNQHDVRINTGTTEKRIELILFSVVPVLIRTSCWFFFGTRYDMLARLLARYACS